MTATSVSPVKHDVRKMDEARQKARSGFSERGESLTDWSLSRGFNPNLVQQVLNGRLNPASTPAIWLMILAVRHS